MSDTSGSQPTPSAPTEVAPAVPVETPAESQDAAPQATPAPSEASSPAADVNVESAENVNVTQPTAEPVSQADASLPPAPEDEKVAPEADQSTDNTPTEQPEGAKSQADDSDEDGPAS